MRLWSLHPRYLDAAGLVACWRESLLAQKALAGATRGYRNHPQLDRFRGHPAAIAGYLHGLADEADARAYRFDRARITTASDPTLRLRVTTGQLAFEREHLLAKLRNRAPERVDAVRADADILPHPLFRVVPGDVEAWERGADRPGSILTASPTDEPNPTPRSTP